MMAYTDSATVLQFTEVFVFFTSSLCFVLYGWMMFRRSRTSHFMDYFRLVTLAYFVVFYGVLAIDYMDAPTSLAAMSARLGVMAMAAIVCYDGFKPSK